ncbi:hypothetical protein [uncultured Endozoicomonas sp.]|uniref:hypothetical protein n=1 Tax=uncultured Endozoicomonas sp. TaxID=432652 RepID=UPI00263400C5|nr:hypothetical protein [uncultured Endozoicomonas sp.]
MKPSTPEAMAILIADIRTAIPFGLSEAELCSGNCKGCSKKLLEFLDQELLDWSHRLGHGEKPNLGDIGRLEKTARKIYSALKKNQLV